MASAELLDLTAEFNRELDRWHSRYGCTVNFVWGYNREGLKQLAVAEIDRPIYRKDAPSGQTLSDAMAEYADKP